jgi:hypothetical protein
MTATANFLSGLGSIFVFGCVSILTPDTGLVVTYLGSESSQALYLGSKHGMMLTE